MSGMMAHLRGEVEEGEVTGMAERPGGKTPEELKREGYELMMCLDDESGMMEKRWIQVNVPVVKKGPSKR